MHTLLRSFVVTAATTCSVCAVAAPPDFSGRWAIDLRTPVERKSGVECGSAEFELKQQGTRIVGSHSMYPSGCGRMNEGGKETVKGVVVNGTAVLVVTSGRNGAIVMGTASLHESKLHWQTLEEVRAGEPEGDSPLILGTGVLSRAKQ